MKGDVKRVFFSTLFMMYFILAPFFLHQDSFGLMKSLGFVFGVWALLVRYGQGGLSHDLDELKKFFLPWCAWLLGLLVLMFVHGGSGFSKYINFYLLLLSLFFIVKIAVLSRKDVVVICAFHSLCVSMLIFYSRFNIGLDGQVFDIYRNTLIGANVLLVAICSSVFIKNKEDIKIGEKWVYCFSGFSIVCALASAAVMEVRTAIVSLGVLCVYLVWIEGRKNRKFALVMCSLFVLFVVFFLLSGRLGQGFNDLLLWKSGHINTSWGTRLELWSLAYRGFLEKILFGWGIHAYEKVISAGLYFPSELGYLRHFHSDYFNILCGGGIVGLFSWLATVGMLFRQSKSDYASVSILLVALALGFSDRYWFRMQEFLFFFGCLWVLLYQTRERNFQ